MNDPILLIRCNDCKAVHEETSDFQVFECKNCGRDDCLTDNFTPMEDDFKI